jgi:hypothetical protein
MRVWGLRAAGRGCHTPAWPGSAHFVRSSCVNRASFGRISTSADPWCSLQRLPRRLVCQWPCLGPGQERSWPQALLNADPPEKKTATRAGACGESFLNPNAGTRAAEETKANKYKFVCSYASSVVWTLYRLSSQRVVGWESSSSGDTGIHTGLLRVAEEDEAMKIIVLILLKVVEGFVFFLVFFRAVPPSRPAWSP